MARLRVPVLFVVAADDQLFTEQARLMYRWPGGRQAAAGRSRRRPRDQPGQLGEDALQVLAVSAASSPATIWTPPTAGSVRTEQWCIQDERPWKTKERLMYTRMSKDGTAIAYEIHRRGRRAQHRAAGRGTEPKKADPGVVHDPLRPHPGPRRPSSREPAGRRTAAGRALADSTSRRGLREGPNRSSTTAPGSWPNWPLGATYRILPGQDQRVLDGPRRRSPRSPSSSTRRPAEPCACGGGCWW